MTASKPKWKKGWPTQAGRFFVELIGGDFISLVIEKTQVDNPDGLQYLHYRGEDACGVVCPSTIHKELDSYWGEARASFGPIPKYRRSRPVVYDTGSLKSSVHYGKEEPKVTIGTESQ